MRNVLKQFGAKVTGSLSGRFHQARVRLTLVYVALVAAILFISSYTLYTNFSGHLAHRFQGFRPEFQTTYNPLNGGILTVPKENDLEGDLVQALVIVNGLLLVAAAIVSYWLAGLTLEPVQRAYNRQRQFLGDASHELRTPLSILQTDLENELDNPKLKGEAREQAVSYLEEVERMGRLVGNLLTLSRLDEQPELPPRLQRVNLSQALTESVHRLKKLAEHSKVTITFNPPAEELEIMAEKDLLEQVFSNIIKNAITYNKEGGEVSVAVSQVEKMVQVVIGDSGIGIGRTDISKIFERFYRVDSSRSSLTGGSGLGLAIVRSALDRFGGSLQVESTVGKGTSVTLVFPLFIVASS